jgi:hypothetical protein
VADLVDLFSAGFDAMDVALEEVSRSEGHQPLVAYAGAAAGGVGS